MLLTRKLGLKTFGVPLLGSLGRKIDRPAIWFSLVYAFCFISANTLLYCQQHINIDLAGVKHGQTSLLFVSAVCQWMELTSKGRF